MWLEVVLVALRNPKDLKVDNTHKERHEQEQEVGDLAPEEWLLEKLVVHQDEENE